MKLILFKHLPEFLKNTFKSAFLGVFTNVSYCELFIYSSAFKLVEITSMWKVNLVKQWVQEDLTYQVFNTSSEEREALFETVENILFKYLLS